MEDEAPLELPADTLRLLQEFSAEQDSRAKKFEELKNQAENHFQHNNGKLSMDLFGEDWNQLLDGADENSAIAVVSAPSVYVQLRNILAEEATTARPSICLLEFDKRFEVIGSDFFPYDYQHPLRLSQELKGKFDRIICDPPFLSEDCQAKTALTVRYLARQWAPVDESKKGLRFITCTGERMESVITKLYGSVGVRTTTFDPEHSKGLSNEFRCYANFECETWAWR